MSVSLHQGDCLVTLRGMADNSVDSIVTDPPYGLSFMGKKWDYDVPSVEIWAECLRVLKPGGHLLAFAGTRTQHRMAVRIEDAGFEIRDMIAWVYGCLDEATEVATESGVMPYHKTKIGDRVLCYDSEHGEYTYQPILEIVEYEYSDTAYRLVGDFGEQVVSRNHRVLVERGGKEAFQLAETLGAEACVPVLESLPALQQAVRRTESKSGFAQQDMQQGVRAWGGHNPSLVRVVPFHYTGKVWCLRVPTGAFVAVRNGVAFPTGNSGFPKSHNGEWGGTALKPALEPITMARKPLMGTVAANVLAHGTGGLNIDGCRVETESTTRTSNAGTNGEGGGMGKREHVNGSDAGRWPANLIHDGSDEVVAGFPVTGAAKSGVRDPNGSMGYHGGASGLPGVVSGYDDNGGSAARFFYCAKASKADREEGLDGAPDRVLAMRNQAKAELARGNMHEGESGMNTAKVRKNHHPTVKPADLMAYLCRLVTPPGGVVLDPFMGSGSTGKAALREGFGFIGCEMSPEYTAIARARIEAALAELYV